MIYGRIVRVIKSCFFNILRQKSRSIMTIIGVAVGCTSIIIMISLGLGLTEAYNTQIEESDTIRLITIYKDSGGFITDEDIKRLENIEHIEFITPIYSFTVYVQTGNKEGYLPVTAMDLRLLDLVEAPVIDGDLIHTDEMSFVAGRFAAHNIKGASEPPSSLYTPEGTLQPPAINLTDTPLYVVFNINEYERYLKGESSKAPKKHVIQTNAIIGGESDYSVSAWDTSVYMSINGIIRQFRKEFGKTGWPNASDEQITPSGTLRYLSAYVLSESVESVEPIQTALNKMGYTTASELDYLQSLIEQEESSQLMLFLLGLISLIASSISITNTMLINVVEKSREIALYKVLGCRLRDIKIQFTFESGLLGLAGGVLGSVISVYVSYLLNLTQSGISVAPVWLLLSGIIFSIAVGVLSGPYPAKKASQTSVHELLSDK